MVDPYERNYDLKDKTYSRMGNPDTDYRKVKENFNRKFPGRHTLIRKSSYDAAKEVDIDLDFIFIDGNHTYKHVWQDLSLWIPKIKPGGLIMGHDWRKGFDGVVRAVVDYGAKYDHFVMPKNPVNRTIRKGKYIPAPTKNPVVMKSWSKGNVWWALKKS